MSRVAPAIMLALATAACTLGSAVAASQGDPAQARAACARLGLDRSELPFQDCVTSLGRSAAAASAAAVVEQDRQACRDSGLQPGTIDFATCVVGREHD